MDLELAKVKAFYYAKVVETGSCKEASKLIQCKGINGKWSDVVALEPTWSGTRYRIKPDTVTHPGGEMPRPLTVEEAQEQKTIYTVHLNLNNRNVEIRDFENDYTKVSLAKFGLAFKTREDAEAASYVIFNLPKPENQQECGL